MRMMMRLRLLKSVAWVMASSLLIPYAANGAIAAVKPQPVAQTVIIFPLDNAAGPAAAKVAAELSDYVRSGLAIQPGYRVVTYSDRLPAVERIERSDPENSRSISGPFYADRKCVANAVSIGNAMSADLIIVGSVDKYATDNGVASLAATAEVINTHTGKTERTVVVTGHSGKMIETAVGTKPSIEMESVADTGEKIVTGITGTDSTQPKTAPAQTTNAKKKSSSKWWIGAAILGLAVGLLVGHHSGSSGSGSSDPPIPGPPNL